MANYIMELRKLVGKRCLLQVGASVIVEDKKGRILLGLRSDNGCWSYPGGSVELDEAVEDAAKRELMEETGLTAHSLTLFGVFSGKDTHYIYPNGDEVSNVEIVYLCREYAGVCKPQAGEMEKLAFFAAEDIPLNLSPPIKKQILLWAENKRREKQEAVL